MRTSPASSSSSSPWARGTTPSATSARRPGPSPAGARSTSSRSATASTRATSTTGPRRSSARRGTGAGTTSCGSPAAGPPRPCTSRGRLFLTFVSDTEPPGPELLVPWPTRCVRTATWTSRGASSWCSARGSSIPPSVGRAGQEPGRLHRRRDPRLRGLLPAPDLVELEIFLTRMGQRLFFPPSVAGWPGGMTWLRGQAVLARANFAAWLTGPDSGLGPDSFPGRVRAERPQAARSLA